MSNCCFFNYHIFSKHFIKFRCGIFCATFGIFSEILRFLVQQSDNPVKGWKPILQKSDQATEDLHLSNQSN